MKLATVPSTSVPLKLTAMIVSSLPDAVVACATGASFTAVTVIVLVALLPEIKPLLSVALYWKLVLPFQSAFGLK